MWKFFEKEQAKEGRLSFWKAGPKKECRCKRVIFRSISAGWLLGSSGGLRSFWLHAIAWDWFMLYLCDAVGVASYSSHILCSCTLTLGSTSSVHPNSVNGQRHSTDGSIILISSYSILCRYLFTNSGMILDNTIITDPYILTLMNRSVCGDCPYRLYWHLFSLAATRAITWCVLGNAVNVSLRINNSLSS
jgi:hypothetical protein